MRTAPRLPPGSSNASSRRSPTRTRSAACAPQTRRSRRAVLGGIDGVDPDALPAVPDGLVGPSDTATCTIDILDGSQEDNREALDACGAMMMDEEPDIGDFCFITFMLRDGSPKTGIFCKIRDSRGVQDAWERAYSDYRNSDRIGSAE